MKKEALRERLHGISSIAVTPMKENGDIDYEGMRSHLKFLMKKGINADNNCVVVVGGSTGECGGMTIDERKRLIETAVETTGDALPVIAGCNHSCTRDVIDLVEHAERVGAAGAMILAPYYYVPTAEMVLRFYREVSKHTSLGILLYNNIEVTHYDIPDTVIEALAEESNVVGIKECSPNFVKMERVVRKAGKKIAVINGHGEFLEPFAAVAGTVGFISSTSNFAPEIAVEMYRARSAGDYVGAKAIRDRLSPYLDLAAEMSAVGGEPIVLAILKRATDLVGSYAGPGRIPLPPVTPELDEKIRAMLIKVGLI